jgi:hypothetical protein
MTPTHPPASRTSAARPERIPGWMAEEEGGEFCRASDVDAALAEARAEALDAFMDALTSEDAPLTPGGHIDLGAIHADVLESLSATDTEERGDE